MTLTGDPNPEPEIGEKPTVHSTSPNIFGIILRSPCHSLRRHGLLFSCRKIALSLFSSDLWESARILHIVIAEAKTKVSANARTSSAQSDFKVYLTCGPSNHSHSPSTIPPTTLLTISLFAGIIRSTSRCCFCWVHYAEAYVYR